MDSSAGKVTTSGSVLNIRKSSSTDTPVVSTLKNGSTITLLSKSGTWWYVEYADGKYGYCHAGYITPIGGTPATVAVSSGTLNVRSGPSTSYSKTGALPKGETVIVLSNSGSWSHILYSGTKTGYVSSPYLSQGGNTISLSVPYYRQNDSRWSGVKLGNSGQTIGQIGCATTGIAMMESYRTGTTIYPDAMSRQLRYTSSGSVYWPSHYTAMTSSSGYLQAIYAQLQEGNAVLFGAKTSGGKQHWVVITGYQGGTPLTASGFTIHDPGTASRTNLQQFLNAYPVFYKYFLYE